MSDSFEKSVDARAAAIAAAKTAAKKAAKKVAKKVATKWNPESSRYFEERGAELKVKYPLRIPKPPIPDNPTERQPNVVQKDRYAHEAWVWHPKEKDWFKHQASFDRDTDMLLKGMAHKTIQNTLGGEENISEIFKGSDGYYYREFLEE
jgi:hypothetical protein